MEACAEECACFSFTIAEKSSLHFCASALGSISCACLGVPSCTFVFTLTSFGVFRRISFKSCYWCREIRNASEWPGIIRCFSKWRLFLFQSKLVHSTLARLDLSTALTLSRGGSGTLMVLRDGVLPPYGTHRSPCDPRPYLRDAPC